MSVVSIRGIGNPSATIRCLELSFSSSLLTAAM